MVPDLPKVETVILEMTNAFRRNNDVGELRREPLLDAAARAFARYLARSGKFSHTADGRQPADRVSRAGYKFCQVAENLALHRDSRGFTAKKLAGAAVRGWQGSPGHRKNMLAPHVVEIGIGVAKAPAINKYISVQLFGRPDALRYEFKIRNTTRVSVRYRFNTSSYTVPGRTEITHRVCLPGQLAFESDRRAAQNKRVVGSRFLTRSNDRFRLRRGASGRIVIDHLPETGTPSRAGR
ncbi:MAG: CAP domain-containing protein [Pseudomonadota bacterium]